MIQRRQWLAVAASALLVFCGLAAVDTKFAQAKDPQIEGTLAGVNVAARTVAIRRVNNTVVAVVIPATAKIERNGVTVGLAAFKLGDRVQAKFNAAGTVVVKFQGVGP